MVNTAHHHIRSRWQGSLIHKKPFKIIIVIVGVFKVVNILLYAIENE